MSAAVEIRPDKKYGYFAAIPIFGFVAFQLFGMLLMIIFTFSSNLMIGSGDGGLSPGSFTFTILACPFMICFEIMSFGMFAPFGLYIWNRYKNVKLDIYRDRLVFGPGRFGSQRGEVPFSKITTTSIVRNWFDEKLGLGQVVVFVADDSPQSFTSYTMPGLADPEEIQELIDRKRQMA